MPENFNYKNIGSDRRSGDRKRTTINDFNKNCNIYESRQIPEN